MTAPTITSAIVSGGTTTLTGTNLTHYSIPTTASKTFTPTDTPAGELKNGATLIESAIMGGGVSLDGVNDYVDAGTSLYSGSGGFSLSFEYNPISSIGSLETLLMRGDGVTNVNGKRENIGVAIFRTSTGEIQAQIRKDSLTDVNQKSTIGDTVVSTNSIIGVRWAGTDLDDVEIFINGVKDTVKSTGNQGTVSSISTNNLNWYFGTFNTNSVFSLFAEANEGFYKDYSGQWTNQQFLYDYNNTQYYYKSGGAGSLIPITPSSTTATSASFTGLSANDVVYVFNKDGSDSAVTVSGSSTQFMTIQGGTSTIEIPLALYGYKTTIAFNKQSVELSDGTIGTFDSGAVYDRYVCEFKLLLKEADADILSNFYKTTDRADTWTLTPQGDFTPFSPLKGLGPFDVKVLEFKEGGVIVEGAYKRYEYVIKIQNVGVFPAHTIPPQVSEGDLSIGSISNLRYPINGITQKTKYKIGAISKYGKSVELTDWTETADSNQATYDLTLRRGNMGALLDELVNTVRFSSLSINTYKPFGPINSDLVNAKLLNSKIEIVHEGHERYTTSIDFIKV